MSIFTSFTSELAHIHYLEFIGKGRLFICLQALSLAEIAHNTTKALLTTIKNHLPALSLHLIKVLGRVGAAIHADCIASICWILRNICKEIKMQTLIFTVKKVIERILTLEEWEDLVESSIVHVSIKLRQYYAVCLMIGYHFVCKINVDNFFDRTS